MDWNRYTIYLANIDTIMRMVVFGIVKISYTIALLVIASKVQVALKKSREMNGKNNGGSLFIIVCSVPLINNFLSLVYEIPSLLIPFLNWWDNKTQFHCSSSMVMSRPFYACVYFIVFSIQSISYLWYFPSIGKKLFVCKKMQLHEKISGTHYPKDTFYE